MRDRAEAIGAIQRNGISSNQSKLNFNPSKAADNATTSLKRSSTSDSKMANNINKKQKTNNNLVDSDSSKSVSASKSNPKSYPKPSLLPNVPLFSAQSARALSALTSKQSLKSKDNPITHSKLGQMTQHYVSASTGHQQSNKVGVSAEDIYLKARYAKLQAQSAKKETNLFKGVIAHITGYTGDRRNTDLIRLLQQNGAQVLPVTSSRITHTISSSPLSAKKTHEALKKQKIGARKFLVKPEWVLDSIEKGRKVSELGYEPKFGAAGYRNGIDVDVGGKKLESLDNTNTDGDGDGKGKGETSLRKVKELEPISKEIKGKKTQRSLFDMMAKKKS